MVFLVRLWRIHQVHLRKKEEGQSLSLLWGRGNPTIWELPHSCSEVTLGLETPQVGKSGSWISFRSSHKSWEMEPAVPVKGTLLGFHGKDL